MLSISRRRFLPASFLLATALTFGVAATPAQASQAPLTSALVAAASTTTPSMTAAARATSGVAQSAARPVNRAALAQAAAAKAVAERAARVARIRSSIVSIALSKVGASYVAGHAGPHSFDCSGLALYVYAKAAGISLPHYSRAQYSMSTHISASNLRPGDLVFFFRNGAHHVAIYIGGGQMVGAANPRHGVRIDSVFGPWYGSHFSGAGRLL